MMDKIERFFEYDKLNQFDYTFTIHYKWMIKRKHLKNNFIIN